MNAGEQTYCETCASFDMTGWSFDMTGWSMDTVNKVESQWGAFTYKQDMDLGRVKMTVKTAKAPVEQFTITLAKQGNSATLNMAWDTTEASVLVTGK